MLKPLRVAVIGAGNMGRHHVRVYAAMKNVELVAVADLDPARRVLAEEYGATFYEDYQLMLASENIDAVSIATHAPLRFSIASYALSHGIHTLVEKPIAHTLTEADSLTDLAVKQGLIFTAGHVERYNPVVQRLSELMQAGTLGDILSVVCKRVGGFPAVEPRTDVIVDLAVHDIDIISYLLDCRPRIIGSHVSRTFHDKADSVEILLGCGGASGFVQANWITPVKVRTIAITGSKGYVEANYITQDILVYEHSVLPRGPEFDDFVKQLGEPKARTERLRKSEPLHNELEAFLRSVRTGDSRGIVSPQEARLALEIALEATNELARI